MTKALFLPDSGSCQTFIGQLRVTSRETRAVLLRVPSRAVLVCPEVQIRMSRDPTDDKFVECAVAGGADCLVSADADLLSHGGVRGIPILDVLAFWQKLAQQREQQ